MKLPVAFAALLALAPAIALVLSQFGAIAPQGSHGTGAWLFDSACFAMLFIAGALNAYLARRGARVPLVMALLCAAAMLAFLLRFGIPFRA